MASPFSIDLPELQQWIAQAGIQEDLETDKAEELLTRLWGAGLKLIEELASRTLRETDVTETLDGSGPRVGGSSRELLQLDLRYKPITQVTSVTENGVALTVGTGYDTSKQCIADVLRGRVIRQPLPTSANRTALGWAEGYQNIQVVFTGGFTADTVPANVMQLIYEAALWYYKHPDFLAKASRSKHTSSQTFLQELSELGKQTLDSLKVWGMPA